MPERGRNGHGGVFIYLALAVMVNEATSEMTVHT